MIRHPNPPEDYALQIYTIAGNTVLFHFAGNSKNFREKNEYEAVLRGEGTTMQSMKYMFKQPNQVAYEQEIAWHSAVISTFNEMVQQ